MGDLRMTRSVIRSDSANSRITSDWDWVMLPVLALALAIRTWKIGWGLPFVYTAEEPNSLIRILEMLRTGTANPEWFHYPSLMFYAYGGLLAVISWIGGLLGVLEGVSSVAKPEIIAMGSGFTDDPWTFVALRGFTILLSVVTVWIVYQAVRGIVGRRWPAAAAGTLMALAPLSVEEARLLAPNTLAALFTAAALWASFWILDRGTTGNYVVAGAMVGLAAGSKYNAVLVAFAVLAAHLLGRHRRKRVLDRNLLIAAYCAMGAFLITTPFAILDSEAFLRDLAYELNHYSTGHPGAIGGVSVYGKALLISFSLSLLLIPFAWTSTRVRRESIVATMFAISYMGYMATYSATFDHNLLSVFPAVAMAIGLGIHTATPKGSSIDVPGGRWAVLSVVTAAMTLSASWTVAETVNLGQPDRSEAVEWIERSLPIGSTILVESYAPWISPELFNLDSTYFVAEDLAFTHWDYVVITEQGSGRFLEYPDLYHDQVIALKELRASTCLVRNFDEVVEIRATACN